MGKILLDYVFPISVIASAPAANTAYLRQVLVVAKPKSGQSGNVGNVYACSTMADVAARTDNTNAQQLFNAGMTKVYVLLATDLGVNTVMDANIGTFWTVLISDDFVYADVDATAATGSTTITSYANLIASGNDSIEVAGVVFVAQAGAAVAGTATFQAATSNNATASSLAAQVAAHAVAGAKVTAVAASAVVNFTAVKKGVGGNAYTLVYTDNGTATVGATVTGTGHLTGGDGLDVGTFDGVVGFAATAEADAKTFGTAGNRCGFFVAVANGAGNMFYAFGKMLGNLATWNNQQFIPMPFDDGVGVLGTADGYFDDRVSFVLNDTDYGNRLALFCAGGKAIAAPYIEKNMRIDLQGRTLQWIVANEPAYTLTEAALLEQRLQEDVINAKYISTGLVSAGTIAVTLVEDNFVASAEIDIAEPKALWRVFGQMQSTL